MKRVRVLIADDNRAILDKVADLLGSQFNVVETVSNGQALLEAATQLDPDLMVVDIAMPTMSGVEAARQLRGSRARIVFLTVHDEPDYVRECFAAGGAGFVVKSRLASDLIPAIEAALAGHTFVSPSVPWV